MPKMILQMRTGETHLTKEDRLFLFGRLQFETLSVSSRFRHVTAPDGSTEVSQIQDQIALRGFVKVVPSGRLAVDFGASSGNGFTSGWNRTGAGSGTPQTGLFLKELALRVRVTRAIEAQYGSLGIDRGQSTEITSYDNEGYVSGARIRIETPRGFYFNSVRFTQGYLGSLDTPSVFRRGGDLARSNYYQLLVSKSYARLRFSADYTVAARAGTARQAITAHAPALKFVDVVHFEQYEQTNRGGGFGANVYAEKHAGRITAGMGIVRLGNPGLYSDRFAPGKRLYWNTHFRVSRQWSVTFLATQVVGTLPLESENRTRFDFAIGYNVLGAIRE